MHMLRTHSTAHHARPSLMSAIEVEDDCADNKLPVHEEEIETLELDPGTRSVAGADRVVPEGVTKPCASARSLTCAR